MIKCKFYPFLPKMKAINGKSGEVEFFIDAKKLKVRLLSFCVCVLFLPQCGIIRGMRGCICRARVGLLLK